MPHLKASTTSITTTSNYALAQQTRIIGFTKITVLVTNSDGTSSIKYKILGSNHPQGAANTFAEDVSEQTLTAGSAAKHVISGPFIWIQVLVKDASGGDHGIANVYLLAVGIA
jgi:hypothetical protein